MRVRLEAGVDNDGFVPVSRCVRYVPEEPGSRISMDQINHALGGALPRFSIKHGLSRADWHQLDTTQTTLRFVPEGNSVALEVEVVLKVNSGAKYPDNPHLPVGLMSGQIGKVLGQVGVDDFDLVVTDEGGLKVIGPGPYTDLKGRLGLKQKAKFGNIEVKTDEDRADTEVWANAQRLVSPVLAVLDEKLRQVFEVLEPEIILSEEKEPALERKSARVTRALKGFWGQQELWDQAANITQFFTELCQKYGVEVAFEGDFIKVYGAGENSRLEIESNLAWAFNFIDRSQTRYQQSVTSAQLFGDGSFAENTETRTSEAEDLQTFEAKILRKDAGLKHQVMVIMQLNLLEVDIGYFTADELGDRGEGDTITVRLDSMTERFERPSGAVAQLLVGDRLREKRTNWTLVR